MGDSKDSSKSRMARVEQKRKFEIYFSAYLGNNECAGIGKSSRKWRLVIGLSDNHIYQFQG